MRKVEYDIKKTVNYTSVNTLKERGRMSRYVTLRKFSWKNKVIGSLKETRNKKYIQKK